MSDFIKTKVKEYHENTIGNRRWLHEHPELSEIEYETSKYIQKELDKANIPYQTIPGETGIVATIKGGKPGKNLLLRADFDALPITEETELPFSSANEGIMHACGHDTHAAIGLTVARILNDLKENLSGTATVLFQSAEETMFGALHALDSGLLKDCDNSIMVHVVTDRVTGEFVCNYGVRCAKNGDAVIKIKGRGGHSSRPEQAVNPIMIGSKIVEGISNITAYEIPHDQFIVYTPTVFNSGSKENIIAETCEIKVNGRYFDDKYDAILEKRTREIATGIAEALGGSAEVTFKASGTPMINDEETTKVALDIIRERWGEDKLVMTPPALFGDDFAYIQKKIPGVVVNIGAAKDGKFTIGHNSHMMVDEDYMDIAIEFITAYYLQYLEYQE